MEKGNYNDESIRKPWRESLGKPKARSINFYLKNQNQQIIIIPMITKQRRLKNMINQRQLLIILIFFYRRINHLSLFISNRTPYPHIIIIIWWWSYLTIEDSKIPLGSILMVSMAKFSLLCCVYISYPP